MKTPRLPATTIALLLAPSLFAVTDTWDGGGADNNISTNLNWLDNTAPVSDLALTDLIFDGTVRLTPVLSGSFSANSLTFNNNAAVNAFTFAGSTLTIGTGGIVNNDAQTETFSTTQITVGTATTTFNAAAGGLAFAHVTLGANTLNFVTTTGASGITTITGSGTLNKSGAGSLNFGAAGAATQAWDLVETAGTFNLNSSTDLTVNTTGSITVNSSTFNAAGNLTMDATPFTLVGATGLSVAAGKTLTLQNGASLSSNSQIIHNTPGTITATGNGSLVNTGTNNLFVSGAGSTLNVLAGADATFATLLLGGATTATVLFNGAGSTATASSATIVGNGGNALLTFSNAASGSLGSVLLAASAGSNGQVNILSSATVSATSLLMVDSAVATETGTLTVNGAGSTFTISGTGTAAIGAASLSVATINVQNSGTFNTGTGTTTLNATGTINLTGGFFNANGNVTLNGGDLFRDATGGFSLAAGKTLTVQSGSFANFATSQFFTGVNATVSGAGSALTTGSSLGFNGGATVQVLAGGSLSAPFGVNFGDAGAGVNTVAVDGAGSQISGVSGTNTWGAGGGVANVTFSNNAAGNFSLLNVGNGGTAGSTGTVLVQSGADVTTGSLLVANTTAATTGAITVTGSGSTWTISGSNSLIVGGASGSTATVNVNASGVFTSGTGTATVNATGTLAIAGGTFNANGNLTVNGGQLTRNGSGVLALASDKTLTVQGGGDAIITGFFQQSVRGNLTVTGSGSTFTTAGDFQWDGTGNTLSLLNVNNGGLISSGGALHLARTNQAVSMTVSGAGAQVVASPNFTSEWQAGVLFVNGASATLGGLRIADQNFGETSFGSVGVQSGSTVSLGTLAIASTIATSTGSLTIEGIGSAVTQTNVLGLSTLTLGAAFLTSATLEVKSGGAFTSGTGAFTLNATGVLNVDGGTATFNGLLADNGGTVNFASGALLFTNPGVNLTVGNNGLLGANLTLTSDQRLLIGGTTTIEPFRALALTGGHFTTSALVNNGTLAFTSGTLAITGAGGFNIGSGALGANVVLGVGANLQVTNTATIASGATLTLNGGSALANTLSNSGTLRANLGTIAAASGVNQSGGRIFIGDTLDISGSLTNVNGGRITLENGSGLLSGAGSLSNSGIVTGDGTIAKPLVNLGNGEVRGELGRTLNFTGPATNIGSLNLLGGTLDFTSTLSNNPTGFISGHGALFTGGLTNQGVLAFSGGTTDVRGDVALTSGARVATSGAGSTTTFFDDVVHSGLEIFTGAGASTVFYGSQSGAGNFTGTGTVYFIGDLRPGNSPASVLYEGDLVFGGASSLTLEIGGLLSGSQYDHLNIGGALHADGDLVLALLGGFTPQVGDTFDLFDVGTFAGNFDTISAPALGGGNAWDFSALKTTGSVTVVPEPGVGVLLLSALGLFGWLGRKLRGARSSRVLVSASRRNELSEPHDAENVHAFRAVQKVREGGTPSPALGTSALPGFLRDAFSK